MIVCRCEGVHRLQIVQAIAAGARTLDSVGRASGAGTRCGACRAAIRRLIAEGIPARPRFASALALAASWTA